MARAPRDRRGYEARSLVRFVRGDHEGAIADITAAIDLAPERPSGYYDRSVYLMALDRVDEAVSDYGRALALDPPVADERAVIAAGAVACVTVESPVADKAWVVLSG